MIDWCFAWKGVRGLPALYLSRIPATFRYVLLPVIAKHEFNQLSPRDS